MEFVETSHFESIREPYLDDQQFNLLQLYLWNNPKAGDVIQGSGGVRKVRWGTKSQGKRGGMRVIYYWKSADNEIYFLTVYKKNEAADLSKEAIKAMREIVKQL